MRLPILSLLLAPLVLAAVCGCQTPNWGRAPSLLSSLNSEPKAEERKPKVTKSFVEPVQIVTIWSSATYAAAGLPATRGFGGRIYFYDREGNAVEVDGSLMLFGYDDSKPGGPGRAADRQYAFTADQLQSHFGETKLGPSYSVWIPWDGIGGPERKISLLPVFKSASGSVVRGQFAMNVLPGEKAHDPMLEFREQLAGSVQPAAAYSNDRPSSRGRLGLTTATFNVSPNLTQQLQQNSANPQDGMDARLSGGQRARAARRMTPAEQAAAGVNSQNAGGGAAAAPSARPGGNFPSTAAQPQWNGPSRPWTPPGFHAADARPGFPTTGGQRNSAATLNRAPYFRGSAATMPQQNAAP